MGKTAKRVNAILSEWKVWLVFLLLGAVLGAFLYARIYPMFAPQQEQSQHTVQTLSPSVVFSRVREEGELVSASQDYSIVDKVTDSNRDFLDLFNVPFTKNSFWYRYNGTIKAGVDLSTAELKQDENDPSQLHVTLDQPHIISNTPDMDKSGVLEEKNNIFNPISVEDSDAFRRQCVERSEEEAIDGGLLDEAKKNAESQLTKIFNAAFEKDAYKLDFTYRDAADE
jgi:hypothetical protein